MLMARKSTKLRIAAILFGIRSSGFIQMPSMIRAQRKAVLDSFPEIPNRGLGTP
jgi:hypothetical protein